VTTKAIMGVMSRLVKHLYRSLPAILAEWRFPAGSPK
jgi:hypothetical protein